MIILFVLTAMMVKSVIADPSLEQLYNYGQENMCPLGILTTNNGAPVEESDTYGLYTPLLSNEYFMEVISQQMRERIPDRMVHAKGAAAFGYFEVTHNITDICMAKLFSKIGKKTPVVVRFSQTSLEKGEADTSRDPRGFATKFYTEEGNLDIVGFHTPMFMYKEPLLFLPIARVIKRNPVTNLRDPTMFWDVLKLRPETLFFFLYLLGDNGIPDGFRFMPGFGIHTYQVYNKCGKSCYVRFHKMPDNGIRNIFAEEAIQLAAKDPDYAVRDLYNAIENGHFPSWTISIQVLDWEDVKKAKFDVFDVTKILPVNKYPLRPIGKLVLNRNPENYFAQVEQTAFCPGNLVRGILGAPDKVFESRRVAYKDTQRYRLGGNFHNIRVNRPRNRVYGYGRDGEAPVGLNGGGGPNYYPNSYNGPVPYVDKKKPKLVTIKQYDDSHNFEQITDMYTYLCDEERERMAGNIVSTLGLTNEDLQQSMVKLFKSVHPDLAFRVSVKLAAAKSSQTK